MGMSYEYPVANQHTAAVLEELRLTGSVGVVRYNNILMTCPSITTDEFDPDMQINHVSAALFWPTGHPAWESEENAPSVETCKFGEADDSTMATETMTMRQVLLRASLGDAALKRIHPSVRQERRIFTAVYGGMDEAVLDGLCEVSRTPLGVCIVSEVLQSDIIPVDSRTAHLFYPVSGSPQQVLKRFKRAVEGMIEAEKP